MEILEVLKAAIIGVIQGITEWLPISSTGHMILADEFIKLGTSTGKEFWDMFSTVIQLGSILAVLVLYFHKLNPFSPKKNKEEKTQTYNLWLKVILASVPAAIIGFALRDFIKEQLYGPITIAITLILYGILFIVMESRKRKSPIDSFEKLDYKMALLIGAFQVLALIPGTSRSGATILGAVLLGTSRGIAAEFSFFLALPVMFGASAYELLKFGFSYSPLELVILLTGTVVAFLVSIAAIKFLMGYIKKHDFKAFGYYRIVLGIIVLLYFLLIK